MTANFSLPLLLVISAAALAALHPALAGPGGGIVILAILSMATLGVALRAILRADMARLMPGGMAALAYLAGLIWSAPGTGLTVLVTGLVLTMLVWTLLVDATGLIGAAAHDITATRLLAVALVAAGMVLLRL